MKLLKNIKAQMDQAKQLRKDVEAAGMTWKAFLKAVGGGKCLTMNEDQLFAAFDAAKANS